jgi:hypothetical protein
MLRLFWIRFIYILSIGVCEGYDESFMGWGVIGVGYFVLGIKYNLLL